MNSDSTPTSSAAATQLLPIGPHQVRVDGPIVICWFVGDFTMEHWPRFVALVERTIAEHGYAYAIGHLREAGSIDAEVRRQAAAWLPQVELRGFANVQAGTFARALAILLANAIRLVTGMTLPSGFFENESKARAWIASQQQRRKRPESAAAQSPK